MAGRNGHADADVSEIGRYLREMLDTRYIAITMAGSGVLLLDENGQSTHLPTYPLPGGGEVGAGDSFIAAMALALAAGADARTAARIGIDAATIACTKRRTSIVTRRELLQRVSLSEGTQPVAARSLKDVATQIEVERHARRRIVFTNGVFDILHAGHVQLLRQAKALGDVLVVGVNSDESVRRLKGPRRPVNREQDRLALIAAIDVVDYAFIFGEDSPAEAIRSLRPDVHVKGGDYTEDSLPEIGAVREVGAEVRILPLLHGRSTTKVIQRISDQAGNDLADDVG
jgi:D-beta-D-heptose 7-phosphate kinase/D-beta-D-heptose 1-phosphate adenosyltransferase